MRIGRNEPCHCGSGQKYKKCHEAADAVKESAELAAAQAKALATREAEAAEAAENPEAAEALAKKTGTRNTARAKPKERIATAANPIRRRAV